MINKKSAVIMSSLALISLTSCNRAVKNTPTEENTNDNLQISKRSIGSDENIIKLDKNKLQSLGSYDYTIGISSYPVIGNVEFDESSENLEISEQVFTLSEVQKITEDISNEYMNYLSENEKYLTNKYGEYINAIESDYLNLENEYNNLLNDFSNYLEGTLKDEINNEDVLNPSENTPNFEDTSNKDENTDTDNKFLTREDEINAIYEKALYNSSKNINEFKPIQGQDQNASKLILDKILNNIELPPYTYTNDSFIFSNYGINKDEIEDYVLIHSKELNSNYFEIFMFKHKNLSDEELSDKLNLRLSSILNSLKGYNNDEFKIEDNVLFLDIDDYTLFCFSKNSGDILNLLEK
ncbi:DUF4358 domain-containing protein [Candidatus Arthromitus sp. SFB-rat-Yit]|uniref:DUF4358 domain-containing protein n=1 Tax=Candidatus Arthromitus sp. SFB-rat-Yit TaxID=1041504 RepID=UPI000227A62F|nr:DUF4358 domain-containing protein [Candidatus Arthromitus sp. SFB-rat-Yit]BAK80589.1 hypothetical protein RATSFB_0027 [Candidatus Arthromitus sp. SFB-rat-Yit]